ncbi:MAG: TIGR02594 family protein [Pseudomonadota bacterium]
MRDLLRTVQGRLAALGYYHLIVDGVPGPGTSNAVVRFKTAHGLRARDKIGPLTLRLLMSPDAKPAPRPVKVKGEPPWLVHARTLLGTREAPGAADNDVIMAWAQGLDQWYPGDDVPWCGLFVAECMAAGAPDEPQDFNRLGARQWLNYGAECDLSLGAVCVLWRGRRDGWKGHVFLVTGQSVDAVRGVGGNQSDAVTETWFSKERVLGYRKPDGAVLNPAPMAQRGVLSTNEA